MTDLAIRKEKLATYGKWGLGLLAALVISPVIFLIVKGIIGLIVAAVLGLAAVNFAPVLAQKFANWKLKAVKYEATRNPVETLQNVYREKVDALAQFLQRIREFETQVRNFSDKVDGFKIQFPAEAPKYVETLTAMQRLLALRKQRYKESQEVLAQFEGEIRKADAIWKMSLAAQELTKAAGMTDDDFMQKVRAETSFDAVQTSLNRAFAELETSLLEETPALTNNPSPVIDVQAVEIKERLHAK